MGSTAHNGGSAGGSAGGPQDYSGLWEMLRGLREDFAAHRPRVEFTTDGSGRDADRSDLDVRTAVLRVLAEKPATGAAVLRTIADRADSTSAPGAAEVYPTLQLLVDEGFATVAEEEGRRTFTLTDEGQAEAAEDEDATEGSDGAGEPEWEGLFGPLHRLAGAGPFSGQVTGQVSDALSGPRAGLPRAGAKLAQAAHQVLLTGDESQIRRATALLEDARRAVYGILAEEPSDPDDVTGDTGGTADADDTDATDGTGGDATDGTGGDATVRTTDTE